MRYAIIRGGDGLPSPDVQRGSLEGVAYDVALEESVATARSQRWIVSRLLQLRRGDDILLWSLDVLLLSSGDLLTLLLRLCDGGVTIHLTQGGTLETLNPGGAPPRALSLLAEHEARRPSREPATRRVRYSGRPLSPYQVKYARQLLRGGTSRRAVGLLFQLAPDELSHQLEFDDGLTTDSGITSGK